MRELYKPDMFQLGLYIYQLECMIQVCNWINLSLKKKTNSIHKGIFTWSLSAFSIRTFSYISVCIELVFNIIYYSITIKCCFSYHGFIFKRGRYDLIEEK
jgi:hypothetical protein